jgi:acyl dehydratase
MYAGASGDYNPIHYDRDAAASRGLPGIVVHGQLVSACLMQLLTDWLGAAGVLKKFSVSYKAMTFPGERLQCRGAIAKKSESGDWLVTLSIWAENPRGEKTVAGTAVVQLPRRAA